MDQLAGLSLKGNFGAADWMIVVAFLVASTIAGMWAMRYIRDMDDYVVAGRSVRTYLGVASMIAAELGLVTVMYSAQMGFTAGFAAFSIAVLAAGAGVIVGRTGLIVVPLRRLGVMTIPEFYERRFGTNARLIGGVILAASGILNMGMFLKADSMFVTSVMGMNDPDTLKWAMTIILALVLLYTAVGGMISVVFTDYLQFTVMAIGLVLTSILLMGHFGWYGSMSAVWKIKGEAGFNPLLPESGIGVPYLVWMLFLGFIGACVWQTSVMRAAAAEDEKVVRRTYTWGAVGFLIRFLIPYFWGICGLIFVWQSPQLRGIFLPEGGQADSSLQLRAMPIALSRLMPAGLIGMLTAGMLAAAMSTYNTYLHTWSAVLTQDVANPLFGGRLSSRTRILCARIIMCVIALFLLIWGLWYPLGERLWDYMAITGAIYFTGAFAVLLGGIYWTAASRVGAYGAFLCGFVMIVGLSPVQHWLRVEWAGPNLGVLTAALAWSTLVILSILFPDVPHTAGACDAAERPKRPVGVSIVGALVVAGYLLGLGASVYAPAELIGGLGLLYPAWAPWPFFRPEGEVWGAAMPYLCLLGIGAGVGLLTGRPWARWLWLGLTLAALPWVAGAALTNMWRAGELALYGTALAALFGRPATMHFLWKPAPGGTAAGSE